MTDIAAAWKDYYSFLYKEKEQDLTCFKKDEMKCKSCHKKTFVYDSNYDETICTNCAIVQSFNCLYTMGMMEYLPDTSNKIKKSIYRHVDYLNRKLDEISCARIKIHDEIMEKILFKLNGKIATVALLKKILRENGYKQKFLQIPTILYTLYPEKYSPLKMNHKQRMIIENMFKRYIETFYILVRREQIKRKNLLNYNFVFKKLFQMKKIPIKPHYFILPKGKKTMEKHNEIWIKICKFNNWSRK